MIICLVTFSYDFFHVITDDRFRNIVPGKDDLNPKDDPYEYTDNNDLIGKSKYLFQHLLYNNGPTHDHASAGGKMLEAIWNSPRK